MSARKPSSRTMRGRTGARAGRLSRPGTRFAPCPPCSPTLASAGRGPRIIRGSSSASKGPPQREVYVRDALFYPGRDIARPMIGYAMDLAWCAALDGATIRSLERRHVTDTGLLFQRMKTGKLQQIDGPDLVEIVRSALRLPPQVRRLLICREGGKARRAKRLTGPRA